MYNVPVITLKKYSDAIRYYIYRGTLKELPDDISAYNRIEPVGCVFNTSDNTIPKFKDDRNIDDDNDRYFGNPVTICNPNVSVETNIETVREGHIPYYTCIIKDVTKPVLLHYRVLYDNELGAVSELSDIMSVEIKQDKEVVSAWIEMLNNNKWIKYQDVKIDTYFDILKPKTNSQETIFEESVCNLKSDDISFDNKYIRSNNLVTINILNPWHVNNSNMHYRKTKLFRVGCTIGDGNILYSDIINKEVQYSPIDKLVILRKEHDGTNSNLSIGDDGVTVKQIIRAGGLYFTKEMEYIQFNEETILNDISIVNFDNCFNTIKVVDKGIIAGRKYKYTFILYDHSGHKSNSLTITNYYK